MNNETKYAVNQHREAIYKMQKHGEDASVVATLTMTTAYGEQSTPIRTLGEYESFLKAFSSANSKVIDEEEYQVLYRQLKAEKELKVELR